MRSFEIPKEMRPWQERSDEQAKLAFTDYSQAAQEAVSTFDQWIEASQVGAQGISKKAMKCVANSGASFATGVACYLNHPGERQRSDGAG
ncbi:MAG: hypothetical protein WAM17_10840 [Rhodoplanes sp.]